MPNLDLTINFSPFGCLESDSNMCAAPLMSKIHSLGSTLTRLARARDRCIFMDTISLHTYLPKKGYATRQLNNKKLLKGVTGEKFVSLQEEVNFLLWL